MYPHHQESLQIMQEYFEKQDVIALIFGGSVAKGTERPDSDLDAMVVVSDEIYRHRQAEHRTAETIGGLCTYEGGYFDVKYMTKDFLLDAAEHGSEPARNAFLKARVLFTRDPEIPDILARIPVFQTHEKEEKLLSFYADYWLNHFYFLKGCRVEGYMRLHAVGEIVYSLYRILLQEHEVLFACNRRLEEQVASLDPRVRGSGAPWPRGRRNPNGRGRGSVRRSVPPRVRVCSAQGHRRHPQRLYAGF